MKKYLVGGAVRDMLMGFKPKDQDWVVVGSTREEMLAAGFTEVGKGFPVFLSPDGEEHALARRDRKVSEGYHGFEVEYDPSVTLREDLSRRDLTINAIAMDTSDNLIDPMGGMIDIASKTLRHINLQDDPLRVLRIARFLARFGDGWTVAPETVAYCTAMKDEEFATLPMERVFEEMRKALKGTPAPRKFFDFLKDVGKLPLFFPEIAAMVDCEENPKYHPEGNTYEHTMLVLQAAAARDAVFEVRLACLMHDMGKPLVAKTEGRVGFFPGHENWGVKPARAFMKRFHIAGDFYLTMVKYHMHMHLLDTMKPRTIMKMVSSFHPKNQPWNLHLMAELGECDNKGRLGSENIPDFGCFEKMKPFADAITNTKFTPEMFIGKTPEQCMEIRMREYMRTYQTKKQMEESAKA